MDDFEEQFEPITTAKVTVTFEYPIKPVHYSPEDNTVDRMMEYDRMVFAEDPEQVYEALGSYPYTVKVEEVK